MPEVITWVDPAGATTILTEGTSLLVLKGRLGAYMPPVSFVEDEVPLQAGAQLRQVKVGIREVDLPFLVKATSEVLLRSAVRTLLTVFNPTLGAGRLRVTGADGFDRELTCRYASGWEGDEGAEQAGETPYWQRLVLSFRAVDPYWYSRNAIVVNYVLGELATFFPIFPLRLTESTIFADAVVVNNGDIEAWPVWTITGPGTNPTIRNLTTGKLTSITTTLAAGDTITIDTRPAAKSVVRADGTNLFGLMTSGSELWPLIVGSNTVRIELASATVASGVVLSYYPRYLGV